MVATEFVNNRCYHLPELPNTTFVSILCLFVLVKDIKILFGDFGDNQAREVKSSNFFNASNFEGACSPFVASRQHGNTATG